MIKRIPSGANQPNSSSSSKTPQVKILKNRLRLRRNRRRRLTRKQPKRQLKLIQKNLRKRLRSQLIPRHQRSQLLTPRLVMPRLMPNQK